MAAKKKAKKAPKKAAKKAEKPMKNAPSPSTTKKVKGDVGSKTFTDKGKKGWDKSEDKLTKHQVSADSILKECGKNDKLRVAVRDMLAGNINLVSQLELLQRQHGKGGG